VDRIVDVFPVDRQEQIRSMLASSLKGVVAQTLCKKVGGGRCAALEVMVVDRGIAALIRDRKMHQVESAIQVGKSRGMVLMNEALVNLVTAGTIDPKEAYIKAVDKDDLIQRYETAHVDFAVPGSEG
jgi:twitching motility protein PilT